MTPEFEERERQSNTSRRLYNLMATSREPYSLAFVTFSLLGFSSGREGLQGSKAGWDEIL